MHKIVKNTSSAPDNGQTPESEVHGGVVGVSVLKIRKCVEGGGRYPRHDGVSLPLRQVFEEVERAEASMPVGRSLVRVLGELFRNK